MAKLMSLFEESSVVQRFNHRSNLKLHSKFPLVLCKLTQFLIFRLLLNSVLKELIINSVIRGGGDTGNDCVGTAIRQGCESVMQLEMMPCPPAARAPGNDWPEWPRVLKTDYGQQEAIAKFGFDPRVYQTTVKEFYKNEAGQVCGALISKLKSEVVDGRRQMVPTGEEFTVDCDLVLIAAGFTGCEPYVADAFGVERTKRGTVADVKYATADPKVFACGDMRRGQSLVVWALREGRDTAAVVDEKLMGYTNL